MDQHHLKAFYENKEYYQKLRDKTSSRYKQYLDIVHNWKIKHLYEVLSKELTISSIIEIGTATGELLRYFPLDTPLENRTGLDISTNHVIEAKKRYPEINFYDIDFEDFGAKVDKKYDLIILSDIIEHIPNDELFLKLAGKISNYVLLNLPLEKCHEFRNREYGPNDYRGHLRAYSLEDARILVKKAGLDEIHYLTKYYVKSTVFRRYLWNKLVNRKGYFAKLTGFLRYLFELLEIALRYKRYKSNYFALLKSQ